MEYTFLLLSGGVGSRMQNALPKQYLLIGGKPMIMHILERIDVIPAITRVIIVCADEYRSYIDKMSKQYGINKNIVYASAGRTRQESVLSGLKFVKTKNVIIHEAARPFVTTEDYQELIDEPCENAITGVDIPFTVLKGHDYIEELLVRSELVNVQLPQKFNTDTILKAHLRAEADNMSFTEDASLLFYYVPDMLIKIIKGKDYNIKMTTRMDMLIGEMVYDEVFRRRK